MMKFCSVRPCAKMSQWQFSHISLCQGHWQQWCHSTEQALVYNLEQPIMEDWVAAVGAAEATNGLVIELPHPELNEYAWHQETLSRPIPSEE